MGRLLTRLLLLRWGWGAYEAAAPQMGWAACKSDAPWLGVNHLHIAAPWMGTGRLKLLLPDLGWAAHGTTASLMGAGYSLLLTSSQCPGQLCLLRQFKVDVIGFSCLFYLLWDKAQDTSVYSTTILSPLPCTFKWKLFLWVVSSFI